MRARTRAARVATTGLVLSASLGLTAPPAHAAVCRRAPAQCEMILDELRALPLVCETIPNTEDPDPYNWDEAAFCDDPDAWMTNIPEGIVANVCPDGRCDRFVQDLLQRIVTCHNDPVRCDTDGG